MEKRAILAAVLSMLVLFGYQYFFLRPQMEAQRQARQAEARKAAAAKKRAEAERPAPRAVPKPRPSIPMPAPAPASKEVVVDTGVARIVLTSLGAGIKQVTLFRYKGTAGQLLSLVPPPKAEAGKTPPARRWLPLYLYGGEFAERANRATFSADVGSLTLTPERPEGSVTFVYR
ncbi:MAG: membrane protein insertase YidC, partial [Nitrospinota bacterium]